MYEIQGLLTKYDASYVRDGLASVEAVNKFAATFYRDVAEFYDCITRVKNVERNPTGYSLLDAPVLGLLVRSWKLLKEVIRYYEENNGELVGILERPLLEAVIVAQYLMANDESVIADYRRCSYKDRLRILRDLQQGSPFLETKAGKRLVASVLEKLSFEGLTEESFEVQKRNRWKLQGKTFRDIFSAVEHDALYPSSYGMMSESIHGSWNDSMDYGLIRLDDGTFSTNPFFQPADIRYVTPLLRFTTPAYRMWLHRIGAEDAGLPRVLDWADSVNAALYSRFDELYGI